MTTKTTTIFLIAGIIFMSGLLNSCKTTNNATMKEVKILPKPVEMNVNSDSFVLDGKTKIHSTENLKELAGFFSEQINEYIGIKPETIVEKDPAKGIILKLDENIEQEEGYTLHLSDKKAVISGKTEKGVFYGIQTFLQILPTGSNLVESIDVPCVTIKDYPRFQWRGMHLDESRHFFGVDFVKSMLDQMAAIKINTFHWHLVDDQGWRIEIKKYPKLTEIGAWRLDDENGVWNYSVEMPKEGDPKYGGFYTQEEIKDIVAYAAERKITIVPEIEMPAHATSMIWAYPEISCKGEHWSIEEGEGFEFSDPLCAGNEKTFEILEGVLEEVIDLFPSKYIHIGGDECKKEPWGECPKCQKRMKEEGLHDLEELQSYFIKRIEKFVVSKGRQIIGWDEILEGGLAPEAAVMSWRGYVGGIEAASQGHEVVMSPTDYCYFDYYQGNSLEEPKAIGGFLPMSKVYNFDPVPNELPEDKHHLILGGQANVWTEYMFEPEDVEYMVFPRLFAMAEVLWTQKDQLDYNDFLGRINPHYIRLAEQGVTFRMPIAEGLGDKVLISGDTIIELFNPYNDPEAKIHYTTDGSIPDENSPVYRKAIKITETTCLKAKVFYKGMESNIAVSWFFKYDPELNGLNCEYYEGKWMKLPDFNQLKPLKTQKINEISAKISGSKKDHYGLRLTGFYEIDEAGEYEFYTSSDDGSKLFINDELVVDNDGKHGANLKSGKIQLEKGKHEIKIIFFEESGGEYLEVGTLKENGEKMPLLPSKLFINP